MAPAFPLSFRTTGFSPKGILHHSLHFYYSRSSDEFQAQEKPVRIVPGQLVTSRP